MGEVTLCINSEASHVGALGHSTGVGRCEGQGLDLIGDHVEGLEASGSLILGGERDVTVVAAADCHAVSVAQRDADVTELTDSDLVGRCVGTDVEVL